MRHVSPQEIADQHLTFFLEKILGRSLQLKRGYKYCAQVQGQMAIANVQWCDFVVYTGSRNGLLIERIYFDSDYCIWYDPLLPSLQLFNVKYVAPEVITRGLLKLKGVHINIMV